MRFSRWAVPALALAGLAAASLAQEPRPATGAPAPKPAASSPDTTPAGRRPAGARRPAAGDTRRLDGIAAVVNNDVVLQSDVEEQLDLFLREAGLDPDSATVDTIRHQLLDQLVNEKLIVAEAKKLGVVVTEAEVTRALEQALAEKKQQLGGEEGFQQQLRSENLTEARLRDKYRAEIERQMTAERMRDKVIPRKSVIPTQTEAEAYHKAHPEKFPRRPPEVRLSVIQIPVTPDSAADASARARILDVRKRILAGEKFAKVAAEVSEDPGSARAGGDLGFFGRGQMDPSFEAAAFWQEIGRLGEPVHSLFGWHLIEVIERDTVRAANGGDTLDVRGNRLVEAHARHVLIRVPTGEADVARARALAERVGEQAVKGTDFATLVRRYSKYQGQQAADGDIGFVPMNSLQANIRAALDTLEIGEVSPVLQNAVGFNIFKLTDRKPERAYQLEEIREELVNAVAQLKFREKYEEWVKGLRSKAHVQIKM